MAKSKNFFSKHKGFFAGLSIGLCLTIGVIAGLSFSMDLSIVNQLEHFTQTRRTNDMFNPIIVNSPIGFMEIEITLPRLTAEAPTDLARIFVTHWRISNPIESVYDWISRGEFVDNFDITGAELDYYCDNPDGNGYLTHFYRLWRTNTLEVDYTYMLFLAFQNANGSIYTCDNPFFNMGDPEPPLLVNETDIPEEDIQQAVLNCSYISFFEYRIASSNENTNSTTNSAGANADGWLNQYTIFSSMKNGFALLIFFLLLILLVFIILFIVFMKKNKKDNDKKVNKKPKRKNKSK